MRFIWFTNLTLALALTACFKTTPAPVIGVGGDSAQTGSSVSSIDIGLPAGGGSIFDGVEISVVRHGASATDAKCTSDLKSKVQPVTATGTQQISHTVQNGCDYLLTVKLGRYDTATSALREVLYSSEVNGLQDDVVAKEKLVGGKVDVAIYVFKVEGAVSIGPDSLAGSTNVIIDVTIAASNTPTTTPPPATPQTASTGNTNTATTPTTPSVPDLPPPQTSSGPKVEFKIAAGTGPRAWNTETTLISARVGQELVITNNDTIAHKIYGLDLTFCQPLINGRNSSEIAAGATSSCKLTAPYNGTPGLADYYYPTTGKFFMRVSQ